MNGMTQAIDPETTVMLRIKGLRFHGHHGATEEERKLGHSYKVDIDLYTSTTATKTDNLAETVDYTEVGRLILGINAANSCVTVERLANLFASSIVEAFPLVRIAKVEVFKLLPPTELTMDSFSVEATRVNFPPSE